MEDPLQLHHNNALIHFWFNKMNDTIVTYAKAILTLFPQYLSYKNVDSKIERSCGALI